MTRPRRVLHTVHHFPPEFTGGTERYVQMLVAEQRALGWEVEVVAGSDRRASAGTGSVESSVTAEGVTVWRLLRQPGEEYGVPFQPDSLRTAWRERVAAFSPDVVHVHHWFNLGDELTDALGDVPYVVSMHDAYASCPRFFLLHPDGTWCGASLPVPLERCVSCVALDDGEAQLSERMAARRARFAQVMERSAGVVSPSTFHAQVMVGTGVVLPERVTIMPLGLDAGWRRVEHAPRPGHLRLASFGNLGRIKGTDLLLDAVRRLGAGVSLDLYGEPVSEERAGLRDAAKDLDVRFHGRYDQAQLLREATAWDLAVFPSRAYETYSLVVDEALVMGVPVVVSDRGALPERVGAGGGLAVAVDTVEPLVDVLTTFRDAPGRLADLRASVPTTLATLAVHARDMEVLYDAAVRGREEST